MAVGIRIKFAGLTQEQFDAVNSHVDPDSNPPKGLLFHASGPIDGGWGVIDFWESRAAFDAFEGRIQQSVGSQRCGATGSSGCQGVPGSRNVPSLKTDEGYSERAHPHRAPSRHVL